MARYATGPTAYRQTIRETEDGRDIERRVFGQITRALEAASEDHPDPHERDLQDALERNQRLWSTLMDDVLDGRNQLPEETRAGIVSLALFVGAHTPEVLAGRKDLGPLIAINRGIMRGLAGPAAIPAVDVARVGA